MENFYKITHKFDKIGVLVFTLLFMTVGFLQLCSFTFGNKIISFVQWPTVALGMLLLAVRFINFKHYIKTRGIILLILFSAGYVVSSLITFSYGWYENLRFLIFTVFQFGLLYATDSNENTEDVKKRTTVAANYFLIVTALFSLLSFIVMILGYNKMFAAAAEKAVPTYYIGFWHGRLYGIYWDPNIAAVTAAAAVILSVYFFLRTQKKIIKVLNVLNISLQFTYIVFSGSRTGNVALSAGAVMFSVLLSVKRRFFVSKIKNVIAIILIAAITLSVTFFGPMAVKSAVNKIANAAISEEKTEDELPIEKPSTEEEKTENTEGNTEIAVFDRGYDLSTDISNQRFAIWKSATEIFKESPIFGVSRANILSFAKENLPNTYIVSNYYMQFDSMHNAYIEILTSGGIVGIALFMAFMLWTVIGIIKNLKKIFCSCEFYLLAAIIGVCTVLSVCGLFIAEMVFVVSPASTVLWVVLGTMNRHIQLLETGEKNNEND